MKDPQTRNFVVEGKHTIIKYETCAFHSGTTYARFFCVSLHLTGLHLVVNYMS
jgi:hypothetical protein